ncbi:MAG: DEAD/DEAH box helicase [Oscillospiraceae bacterium]|jgi:ATP-dependent Lhr-like helicase|nr:DEAD/DEAH box helicase [Oscillospiraceae bacterium]
MDRESAAYKWFGRAFGAPTSVQSLAWDAIEAGRDVLASAPTGTGKTLAAFFVFIAELSERARRGELTDELFLIYVSPLKSLAEDIRENLRRPIYGIASVEREEGMRAGASLITTAVRTGDTTASERRSMLKKPPHILITTPESLYLLLTSASGQKMLRSARALIIDELHAVINTKRGAHLMLSAARLDALCSRRLQRIGLSATVAPLETAAEYLSPPGVGSDPARRVEIVAPKQDKRFLIRVVSPFPESGVLPEGSIWPELARVVAQACENGENGNAARTALAFTENRRAAEKLAYYVNELKGDGFALVHHGSVSKEQRRETEERLRRGEVRLLAATSSMELGIDVGAIDVVLQIGCPRGIASAMQRLGRAGHTPGGVSVMKILPREGSEALYCALTASVATEGLIERARPPELCLDILAQHLAAMTAVGEYTVSDALALVRRAYPFRNITREDIEDTLKMLAGDHEHSRDIPVRPRVIYDRLSGTVSGDSYTRLLALSSGGTIPDKGLFTVKNDAGVKLGEADEEFTFERRVGDKFMLGAFAWKITSITRDTIIVSPTSPTGAMTPFWKGEAVGRELETGLRFGELLRSLSLSADLEGDIKKLGADDDSARRAAEHIKNQIESTGLIPDDRTIIAEHFTDETGVGQLMLHSVFGGRVNAPLALLARAAAEKMTGMDIGEFNDDDGFLLFPFSDGSLPEDVLRAIDIDSAEAYLRTVLPETPLFSMAFRYNAARALMMGVKTKGRTPLWVQRLRAAETLTAIVRNERHPLIRETTRECFEDYWDVVGAMKILRAIQSGEIHVREVYTDYPSPFSLPLRRAAEAGFMYDYSPTPAGIHDAVRDAAEVSDASPLPPSDARLEQASQRPSPPESAEALHTRLMIEGDCAAGDIDAPPEWFDSLARAGRAMYIEPGLWIAAEHAAEYESALVSDDTAARLHILRRALRYRGGMDGDTASERYFWEPRLAAGLLSSLEKSGEAISSGGVYYHAELYERARRETVRDRRRAAVTRPPERYAALLLRRRTLPAPPAEQLLYALGQLRDSPFPAEMWERLLLPARVRGYRPELLDAALAGGEFFWRYDDGSVSFFAADDAAENDAESDNESELEPVSDISEYEREILRFLRRRGASFARALPPPPAGETPGSALFSLIARGLIRSDSFAPVRRLCDPEPKNQTDIKRAARARAAALSGRLEATGQTVAARAIALEAQIERAFDSEIILCRETARGRLDWSAAIEILRIWELTGRARRGYFVEGLGGAQFIRGADYETVAAALASENGDVTWISAVDPALKWGKTLKHSEGRSFVSVPGTLVGLIDGLPVAVFERRGAVLRQLGEAENGAAAIGDAVMSRLLRAFAREFSLGTVYADARRIAVREYPATAADALREAGFMHQMNDFILYRSGT